MMIKRFISFLWKKKNLTAKFSQLCEDLIVHEKLVQKYKSKTNSLSSFLFITIPAFTLPILIILYSTMDTNKFKMVSTIFFILIPFAVFVVRNIFLWYYTKKIAKLEAKCARMNLLKEEMISSIMEKETYKNVHELFTKYAPDRLSSNLRNEQVSSQNAENESPLRRNDSGDHIKVENSTILPQPKVPPENDQKSSKFPIPIDKNGEKIRLPRPLVVAGSGLFGRFLDYILGDGPHNRYALICHKCFTHNGMALSDDVGNLVYHCYCCRAVNYLSNGGSVSIAASDDTPEIKEGSGEFPWENDSVRESSSDLDAISVKKEIDEGDVNGMMECVKRECEE